MSVAAQQRSILRSMDQYSSLLKDLSEEDFQLSPAEGVWSYAEVFSHIFKSNLVCLTAAEQCINRTALQSSVPTNWVVKLILFFGRFPPGKFQVPASVSILTEKLSKEDARNLMLKFKSRLADIAPRISSAGSHHKVKHPRLGLLNALQWFRFIQIHTRHHEKQLNRITIMIGQKNVSPK